MTLFFLQFAEFFQNEYETIFACIAIPFIIISISNALFDRSIPDIFGEEYRYKIKQYREEFNIVRTAYDITCFCFAWAVLFAFSGYDYSDIRLYSFVGNYQGKFSMNLIVIVVDLFLLFLTSSICYCKHKFNDENTLVQRLILSSKNFYAEAKNFIIGVLILSVHIWLLLWKF